MKIDKYWVLTILALSVAALISLGSYFLTFWLSEKAFLHSSLENALNYVEITAVSAGSKKRASQIKEILEKAPYIDEVVVGPKEPSGPFEIRKDLIFPDGKLPLLIKLDRELIEERASSLAKKAAISTLILTFLLLGGYLIAIRELYLKPLNRLRRDVNKIYRGILKKIPLEGEDEFGRIRESINQMIDGIKERDERAEIISQFIQLLTVGKGFNGEFVELMRKVLKITETDGVIIGITPKESSKVRIKVITPTTEKEYYKDIGELEGIEPYILEIQREVETTKKSLLSETERGLGIEYIYGMPLKVFEDRLGYVIFFRKSDKPLAEENKNFIKNIAKSIAVSVEIKRLITSLEEKLKREKELFRKVLKSLVRGIEARDSYTRGHSERVAYYSKRIAQEMGLPEEEVNKIYTAALLHDIGKIGIPDSILLKPGKLTDREYEIIKFHPILSYELLNHLDFLEDAIDGIKYHHERWDGSGYPEGLKGEEIPLSARIIAVADSFDAMTSQRIYRRAMDRREAVRELHRLAGKKYDPRVIENAIHILLNETPPELDDQYLEDEIIKEIEERRLDYFLRDHLTGVFNRNALELAYTVAKERFVEVAGLVVDIVRLREINIKEGWEKGDEVLRKVIWEIHKRAPNLIAVRYSGDNFLLLTSKEHLQEVEEKIKEVEEELGIKLKVLRIDDVSDTGELKKKLTEVEFEA